jgi:hypothetical protein
MYQGAPSCVVSSSNHKLSLPKQASRRIGSVHDSIKTDHCVSSLFSSPRSRLSIRSLRTSIAPLNRSRSLADVQSQLTSPPSAVRTPEPSDIPNDFIMAGHGHHSFNGPPKPPVAHVPRIYRFTATALGAGMWFFVSQPRRIRF